MQGHGVADGAARLGAVLLGGGCHRHAIGGRDRGAERRTARPRTLGRGHLEVVVDNRLDPARERWVDSNPQVHDGAAGSGNREPGPRGHAADVGAAVVTGDERRVGRDRIGDLHAGRGGVSDVADRDRVVEVAAGADQGSGVSLGDDQRGRLRSGGHAESRRGRAWRRRGCRWSSQGRAGCRDHRGSRCRGLTTARRRCTSRTGRRLLRRRWCWGMRGRSRASSPGCPAGCR